jgi:hypothetical protein
VDGYEIAFPVIKEDKYEKWCLKQKEETKFWSKEICGFCEEKTKKLQAKCVAVWKRLTCDIGGEHLLSDVFNNDRIA